MSKKNLLAIIGPGILVAATGVGAGDLATAAFTGNKLGVAILWAVLLGALLKFVINEGLTRWQLATGSTLLEGCVQHLGKLFGFLFVPYLVLWSFLVGLALMSACGATAHAVCPLFSPETDKVVYGIAHSALALLLVRLGGYALFEKVMTFCIGIMFAVVIATAIALKPPIGELVSGLLWPTIPQFSDGGMTWTIALLGGVGGTLTVLCYGYWIREENRQSISDLGTCRLDLGTGYLMTALFGIAMVIIGSQIGPVEAKGAKLLVNISDALQAQLGSFGTAAKWGFLIGAWGAVFSSLLGVWQAIPYLFTDYWNLTRNKPGDDQPLPAVDTRSRPYQLYQWGLATIPAIGLGLVSFEIAQKTYAVVGALIIPFLAAVLLYLNNRKKLIGDHGNHLVTNFILVIATVFFIWAGWLSIQSKLFG